MRNTSLSIKHSVSREVFGSKMRDWDVCLRMIHDHLFEVTGRVADIQIDRYMAMQEEERLVWIVARLADNALIGFSSHWLYRDVHFGIRVGHDDLWHVERAWRGLGIGRALKEAGLEELRKAGAAYTSDNLRAAFSRGDLMESLGYHRYAINWRKPLT